MYNQEFENIYNKCKDFTMTSKERCFALYNSVRYVILNKIPGDFIECGVFKGGSSMVIALTLKSMSIADRKIILCDTFNGMTQPTDHDVSIAGESAKRLLENEGPNEWNIWCYCPFDEVQKNIISTGYDNVSYVIGDVKETLSKIEGSFSLVRLDTDWYESTKVELENLYPRLSNKGILIIDDYGHWQGSRKAVDEYFINPMINWIDYTGILIQKYE